MRPWAARVLASAKKALAAPWRRLFGPSIAARASAAAAEAETLRLLGDPENAELKQREAAQALAALEERHGDLTQRFDAVVAARDDLQLEKQERGGALEALQARYDDLAQRFGALVAARDYLQLEKQERSGALEGLQARYDDLARRLSALVAARDDLQLEKQERGGALEGLQARYDDLAKRFGDLVAERNYLQLQIADRDGTIEGRDAYHKHTIERVRKLETERATSLARVEARLGVRVVRGDPGANVSLAIPMNDGTEQIIDVPTAPFANQPSSYFVAYAKAGSVLLDGLLKDITEAARQPSFNLYEQLFMHGYPSAQSDFDWSKLFRPSGIVYYGFRDFPNFALPLSPSNPLALLVRDPRDMLVSAYYSRLASHALPVDGPHRAELLDVRKVTVALSIDEFCHAHGEEYMRSLHHNRQSGSKQATIFRYEDIIFRKAQFVSDLCALMGVELARDEVNRIAQAYDIMPRKEDIGAHVRQVRPGNFREKLSADTIAFLNETYRDFLAEYDYPLDEPSLPNANMPKSPRRPRKTTAIALVKKPQATE